MDSSFTNLINTFLSSSPSSTRANQTNTTTNTSSTTTITTTTSTTTTSLTSSVEKVESSFPSDAPAGSPSSNRSSFAQRLKIYQDEVKKPVLDFERIQKLAFDGIPEHPGLRALYWKILLNYLPLRTGTWPEVCKKGEESYQSWVRELFVDPRGAESHQEHEHHAGCEYVECKDHPLSVSVGSNWAAYFKCKEMLHEIEKDVKRTLPHLHFFQDPVRPDSSSSQSSSGPTSEVLYSPISSSSSNENQNHSNNPQNNNNRNRNPSHYNAIRRILFVYARLNPGISYVQGMNEIVGPLYYVFATDPDPDARAQAESATFYCFTNLMSEIMNNFIKTLDKAMDVGVVAAMGRLNSLLKYKDPVLWFNLESKKLNPQFYSFRWITLLCSQEFELPDLLRLWDSFFSDQRRFEFLYYFCCGLLVNVRDQLLQEPFAENLKLLQNYPPTDIIHLIKLACHLREPHVRISKDITSEGNNENETAEDLASLLQSWITKLNPSVKENENSLGEVLIESEPFSNVNTNKLNSKTEDEEDLVDSVDDDDAKNSKAKRQAVLDPEFEPSSEFAQVDE